MVMVIMLVVQLLKDCCNLNPPKPQYDSFWDPDITLNYFISLGPDGSLPNVFLSKKLAKQVVSSCYSFTRFGVVFDFLFFGFHFRYCR